MLVFSGFVFVGGVKIGKDSEALGVFFQKVKQIVEEFF